MPLIPQNLLKHQRRIFLHYMALLCFALEKYLGLGIGEKYRWAAIGKNKEPILSCVKKKRIVYSVPCKQKRLKKYNLKIKILINTNSLQKE